jgi:ABC-type nitrate/sulfonate/bicarbonate transport system substrate-binding protein
LPSFGNVVITGKDILENNHDLAVRFTRALSRVMAYLSDPENMKEAAYLTIEKYSPTYAGREEYIAAVLSDVYAGYLWQSDDTKAFGFGFGNVERWQNTADLMSEYEIIPKDVNAEDFVIPRI